MTQSMKFLSLIPVVFLLSACLGGGGGGSSSPTDAISITSISPASGVAGTGTTYTVDVSYTLASKPAGLLMIGFNTSAVNAFNMIPPDFTIVQGSGTHTFTATVNPLDWAPSGTFQVYVNLSEDPHPPTWTPLAYDYRTIPVGSSALPVAAVSADPSRVTTTPMPCSGTVCF